MNKNTNISGKAVGDLPQNKGDSLNYSEQKGINNEHGFGFNEFVSMRRVEILFGILGAPIAGLFIGGSIVAAFLLLRLGN